MLSRSATLKKSIQLLSFKSSKSFNCLYSTTSDINNNDSIVQLPQIERLNNWSNNNQGIPGLLSQSTINDIWFNQSNLILDDIKYFLNESTNENYKDCFINNNQNDSNYSNNIIINQYNNLLNKISNSASHIDYPLLDSVSSIHNLFYFLSSIKVSNEKILKPTSNSLLENDNYLIDLANSLNNNSLNNLINKNFNSTLEFLTLLYDTSLSIKGNGYTWLLFDTTSNESFSKLNQLSILNTYNNGTLYKTDKIIKTGKSHDNKINGLNDIDYNDNIPSLDEAKTFQQNILHDHIPLLAIGSNPSFWLRDYGVYGKKLYLKNVLNSIDWDIVASRLPEQSL